VVTVTGEVVDSADQGSAWLKEITRDRQRVADAVKAATRIVNRALGAARAGAQDPLLQEVGASRALAIRLGHGTGDELAEGRWTEAIELPQSRAGRLEDVEPQSRVAAVLAGRDRVHPAETLLLRARLDAEQGRTDEARYGLRAARTALEEQPSEKTAKLREQLKKLEAKLRSS
jgi:hypothetical protein